MKAVLKKHEKQKDFISIRNVVWKSLQTAHHLLENNQNLSLIKKKYQEPSALDEGVVFHKNFDQTLKTKETFDPIIEEFISETQSFNRVQEDDVLFFETLDEPDPQIYLEKMHSDSVPVVDESEFLEKKEIEKDNASFEEKSAVPSNSDEASLLEDQESLFQSKIQQDETFDDLEKNLSQENESLQVQIEKLKNELDEFKRKYEKSLESQKILEKDLQEEKEIQTNQIAELGQNFQSFHEKFVVDFLTLVSEKLFAQALRLDPSFLAARLKVVLDQFQKQQKIVIRLNQGVYDKQRETLKEQLPGLEIVGVENLKESEFTIQGENEEEFLYHLEEEIGKIIQQLISESL
jgi:hypothetical protein